MVNVRPLALAAALLAACAGSGASAPRTVPVAAAARAGPIPLEPGFPALRALFDADAARARLVVLASPT
ncbi:MAG: hypothetical protein ACJ79E_21220 [Anaeromyxobacteraceae bacterium]